MTILYGHIKFLENSNDEFFKFKINNHIIRLKGKDGKWLTNIPLIPSSNFSLLEGDKSKIVIEKTKTAQYHPDQIEYDNRYKIQTYKLGNESINYSISEVENPRKLLITFPGVSNFDNVNYRLSALTSIQDLLVDTCILAFQDKEAVYGNYMFESINGFRIKETVLNLIMSLCEKYNLTEENLIFYGNSKGGTIAIDYIKEFPNSYFFIDIPQIILSDYKSQNSLMRYSLGEKCRNYYNFKNYLLNLVNYKVNYSFAEFDDDSSKGLGRANLIGINVTLLKDMGHSNSAMELTKRQFSKIMQLTNAINPINRPSIRTIFEIRDNKAYFFRVLGAFKQMIGFNLLYAELTLKGEYQTISVSLNKKLQPNGTLVYWRNGLQILDYIPNGKYNMTLNVYYKYKEFCYPLNKVLLIDQKGISIENIEDNKFTL